MKFAQYTSQFKSSLPERQQGVSDEEIQESAEEYSEGLKMTNFTELYDVFLRARYGFQEGAEWMREKLSQPESKEIEDKTLEIWKTSSLTSVEQIEEMDKWRREMSHHESKAHKISGWETTTNENGVVMDESKEIIRKQKEKIYSLTEAIDLTSEQLKESEERLLNTELVFKGFKEQNEKELDELKEERKETLNYLRGLCKDFGDNEWEDDLHLTDIIDKHLAKQLYSNTESKEVGQEMKIYSLFDIYLNTNSWREDKKIKRLCEEIQKRFNKRSA